LSGSEKKAPTAAAASQSRKTGFVQPDNFWCEIGDKGIRLSRGEVDVLIVAASAWAERGV